MLCLVVKQQNDMWFMAVCYNHCLRYLNIKSLIKAGYTLNHDLTSFENSNQPISTWYTKRRLNILWCLWRHNISTLNSDVCGGEGGQLTNYPFLFVDNCKILHISLSKYVSLLFPFECVQPNNWERLVCINSESCQQLCII